jgi:hypothetical protein
VVDITNDYRTNAQGGSGEVSVYLKAGSAPIVSDLVAQRLGSVVYNTTLVNGLGNYPKCGLYLHRWRNQSYVDADDPACTSGCGTPYQGTDIDNAEILIDDVVMKNQHEF